jgi:hypothetical protein
MIGGFGLCPDLIRFKDPASIPDLVIAASVEVHGEHVVFLKIGRQPGGTLRSGNGRKLV